MIPKLAFLCAAAVLVVFAAPEAGQCVKNANGGIALHADAQHYSDFCSGWPGWEDCGAFNTHRVADDGAFYAYICAVDIQEVNAIEYGVDVLPAGSADFLSWQTCWPEADGFLAQPGDGIVQRPADCAGGPPIAPTMILAVLEVSPRPDWERLMITAHPVSGVAKITDCDRGEVIVDEYHLGVVNSTGWNPCLVEPVPLYRLSWGRIKALYR